MAQDVREFPFPEDAITISELVLLLYDLDNCKRSAKLWLDTYAKKDSRSREERTIEEALFRDTVVQLVSVFDQGYQHNLIAEEVFTNEKALAYFNSIKDLRDTYAAHRFGPYRYCEIGVALIDGQLDRLVHDPRVIGLEPESGQGLIQLIDIAGSFAQYRLKALVDDVTHRLKEFPLSSLPPAKPGFTDWTADPRRGRDSLMRQNYGIPRPARKKPSRARPRKPDRS